MAREIERKFLVNGVAWKQQARKSEAFAQGYLNQFKEPGAKSSVRIRIEGERANINIKSLEIGLSRDEYEYEIPLDDAKKMLREMAVGPVVEKTRYWVDHENHTWEIDEFEGDNAGLIVAEVELNSEQEEPILPDWVSQEVTQEPRYYNISLSQYPYNQWNEKEKHV